MRLALRPLLSLILLCLCGVPAHAVLNIEITQGTSGGIPVAILPFQWRSGSGGAPVRIGAVVSRDLARSGSISPVARSVYPESPQGLSAIDMRAWRDAGVEAVLVGETAPAQSGGYAVSFRLYDTIRGEQLLGYRIPARAGELRKAAHKISDLVFEALTGRRGAFSTRLAYVRAELARDGGRRYLLQVADSDGYNPRTIYASGAPIMSPAWSPDGRRIAYVSFERRRSEIYVQDVLSGKRERLSGRPGINSAPAWSPDGRHMALVLSIDGGAQIYILDLHSARLRRLTHGPGVNTEPAWTPDGGSLIFTSDRSGQPQLYRIPAAGGRARRVSFEGKYNAAPAVSPDGRRVAMVHGTGSGFRIAILDLGTGALQVLTDGFLDESPSFAPNGTLLIYGTEFRGRGILATVSEDGRVKEHLTEGTGDVREPAWSPFLQ